MALPAHEVVARFAAQTLTPSDYLCACLEHISLFNPKVNALTALDAERAVTQASQATQRWKTGTPIGPLDGLPIGVKDLQDTKGLLTTHGSKRGRSNVPTQDLPMVARRRVPSFWPRRMFPNWARVATAAIRYGGPRATRSIPT